MISRDQEQAAFRRRVARAQEYAATGKKSLTIYRGREAFRSIREVQENGCCEVLCGKVWRLGYIEPNVFGKIFVGPGQRPVSW